MTETTANDNDPAAQSAISLSDLASMSGIDEDTLLWRLAGILDRRIEHAEKSDVSNE